MKTYVFYFYNLYIPKDGYVNAEKGIRITPLRIAERFEKERKNLSSQFRYGGFKTAKCYIKANNEEEAKKIANWLEMIYSFAQSRSVYFSEWYSYKKGGKYISSEPKQIEPIENRFSELVSGTRIGRISFKKDISLFVNTALDTLKKSEQQKQDEIMIIIYAYMISKSQMVNELKFLIGWIALEKLANEKYNSCIYTNRGLNKTEIKKLKKFVKCSLKLYYFIKRGSRINHVIKNMRATYLYEQNTKIKMKWYLESLDLSFDNKELEKLIKIRRGLVHNLHSNLLLKNPQYTSKLQRLMQDVIFKLLGVNDDLKKQFILKQYNMGRPFLLPSKF